MNKIFLLLVFVLPIAIACKRKPYVEHKLEFEKVSADCKEQQSYFRMNSNFGGERYEFEKCLPADFSKDKLKSTRSGDTVLVSFPAKSTQQPNAVYHLTLDIDSYPQYHFLTIDGDTYTIIPSQK
jgi:hypothetical protein